MRIRTIALAGMLAMTAIGGTLGAQPAPAADDPFLYLEEIEGERALAWARKENERSLGTLQADPRYAPVRGAGAGDSPGEGPDPLRVDRADRPLQFLAGRDERSRPVAAHHPRQLPNRRLRNGKRCSTSTRSPRRRRRTGFTRDRTACRPRGRAASSTFRTAARTPNVVREFDLDDPQLRGRAASACPRASNDADWLDADTIIVGARMG